MFDSEAIHRMTYLKSLPRPSWDEYFMALAKLASTRSTCSVRSVGCVIVKDKRVIATGYNGAPPGKPHCCDKNTENFIYCAKRQKDVLTLFCENVHAEINALDIATKMNLDLVGSSVYVTLSPCVNCLKKLHKAGVENIYYEYSYTSKNIEKVPDEEEIRSKFKIFQQVLLSDIALFKIINTLESFSSLRSIPSSKINES